MQLTIYNKKSVVVLICGIYRLMKFKYIQDTTICEENMATHTVKNIKRWSMASISLLYQLSILSLVNHQNFLWFTSAD